MRNGFAPNLPRIDSKRRDAPHQPLQLSMLSLIARLIQFLEISLLVRIYHLGDLTNFFNAVESLLCRKLGLRRRAQALVIKKNRT